ncbi:MAG: hypothetical protein AMXMBFR49_07350 [Chlorobiota bacterium]
MHHRGLIERTTDEQDVPFSFLNLSQSNFNLKFKRELAKLLISELLINTENNVYDKLIFETTNEAKEIKRRRPDSPANTCLSTFET